MNLEIGFGRNESLSKSGTEGVSGCSGVTGGIVPFLLKLNVNLPIKILQ